MGNINVHEFIDKTPSLTDIVPTQSSSGTGKYTWQVLLNSILKMIYRSSNAPANTDALWIMPDNKIYYHNGTSWVAATGDVPPESHDFNAYVSPTGDNNSYAKGNSHNPAGTFLHVYNHTSYTNNDIITLFAGTHAINDFSIWRTDRNTIYINLWHRAKLGNDNITNMFAPNVANYNLSILGNGDILFYGVTYLIIDTVATKLGALNIDINDLTADGTSSNFDQSIIRTFSQNVFIKLNSLNVLRSCPVFDFQGHSNTTFTKSINIDRVSLYNTAFTAYNAGLINLRQTTPSNTKNLLTCAINYVTIDGVREPVLYYSKDMMYDKSVVNVKFSNVYSKVTLAGSTPNPDYDTSIRPALISIEKSNLPTVAFTNSILNFEIENVYTAGSLIYLGDLQLNECIINIKIGNAMCLRQTPIIIDGLSLINSKIIIDANVDHYAKNGDSPIAIIKTAFTDAASKIILKGNYNNYATTKPCIQVVTGTTELELHDASFIVGGTVAFITGQSASTTVAMKNVSTNTAVTNANIIEAGQAVVRNANYN